MAYEQLIITVLSSSLLASIIGSLISQWYQIRSNKELRKFHQKEERFFNLLSDIAGYQVGQIDVTQQKRALEAYRQLWLYASDETIRKMNDFFIGTGARRVTYEELSEADRAHCNMILQLRKEFHGDTNLRPEEYIIIRATRTR